MKNLFLILSLGFITNIYSQEIIPLYNSTRYESDAYYKDTYNDLDNYVGTWKFTQGNTSLTIQLIKIQQYDHTTYEGSQYYMDILIGEYKYIENGIEKINTLPQMNANLTDVFDHNIGGNIIVGPHSVFCTNCGPNDRKMMLIFSDPDRDIFGMAPKMIFQRVDENGVEKLKLKFYTTSTYIKLNGEEPQYTSYTIPFGEYVLVKQP